MPGLRPPGFPGIPTGAGMMAPPLNLPPPGLPGMMPPRFPQGLPGMGIPRPDLRVRFIHVWLSKVENGHYSIIYVLFVQWFKSKDQELVCLYSRHMEVTCV